MWSGKKCGYHKLWPDCWTILCVCSNNSYWSNRSHDVVKVSDSGNVFTNILIYMFNILWNNFIVMAKYYLHKCRSAVFEAFKITYILTNPLSHYYKTVWSSYLFAFLIRLHVADMFSCYVMNMFRCDDHALQMSVWHVVSEHDGSLTHTEVHWAAFTNPVSSCCL